jgi:hypothetical protein
VLTLVRSHPRERGHEHLAVPEFEEDGVARRAAAEQSSSLLDAAIKGATALYTNAGASVPDRLLGHRWKRLARARKYQKGAPFANSAGVPSAATA